MKSNNFKFVEDSKDIGTTQVKNKSLSIKSNNFKVIEDPKEDGTTVLNESVLDDCPKGANTELKTENPILIMFSGLNDFYGADGIYIEEFETIGVFASIEDAKSKIKFPEYVPIDGYVIYATEIVINQLLADGPDAKAIGQIDSEDYPKINWYEDDHD